MAAEWLQYSPQLHAPLVECRVRKAPLLLIQAPHSIFVMSPVNSLEVEID